MTNEYVEPLARVLARTEGRAVLIRNTSSIAAKGGPVFGIAPIKVVAEQRVQAIAFGLFGSKPKVVVSINPLSRESGCLEPFANELDEYLETAFVSGYLPRVWLPYNAALEVLEIIGHRYRNNPGASPLVQKLGWQCYALAKESTYSGQQIVVIASDLLRQHLVTGQQPIEEAHLGALLAWVNTPSGVDPIKFAEQRALTAAASMLERGIDDRIEVLRMLSRKKGRKGDLAKSEIEKLLKEAAVKEWDLLQEARQAFASLNLQPSPRLNRLVDESRNRFFWSLKNNVNPPSRQDSLSRLLESYEYASEQTERINVHGDTILKERLRRIGRIIKTKILIKNQPINGRKPCQLIMRVEQNIFRLRKGIQLSTLDGHVVGYVLNYWSRKNKTYILLNLKKGVKRGTCPLKGNVVDWYDNVEFDSQFYKNRIFTQMRDQSAQLVYGTALPICKPRLISEDLLEIAENLLKD